MSQTPAALQAANAVFQEQFKPAVRLMVAKLVEAAKRGQIASEVYTSFALLAKEAGYSVVSAAELLDPIQSLVKSVCVAFVNNGVIHRNDPIFDGFDL